MLLIAALLVGASAGRSAAIKCYSCASAEYKPIFERNDVLARGSGVPQFDRFCDIEESVQAISPVESCESTCITIFEPQYFGGLRSPHRPYLFLRGCAARLLAAMETPPREVEFLHRAAICVSLPLSQIYPKVYTNEVVEVCSCVTNGCNFHIEPNSSRTGLYLSSSRLVFVVVALTLLLL